MEGREVDYVGYHQNDTGGIEDNAPEMGGLPPARGTDLGRIADAMERFAASNERIVELATEERQITDDLASSAPPPYCPNCQTFDPVVSSKGGEGRMSDFVLVAQCSICNEILYAQPIGWNVFSNYAELEAALKEAGSDNHG